MLNLLLFFSNINKRVFDLYPQIEEGMKNKTKGKKTVVDSQIIKTFLF